MNAPMSRHTMSMYASASDMTDAMQAEIDALKARIAEIERDAARYRYFMISGTEAERQIDAAIDAAKGQA